MTLSEGFAIIMSFVIRHGLTDYALEDLLELLNLIFPHIRIPSLYLFLKKFPVKSFITHYYCPHCLVAVEFIGDLKTVICDSCQEELNLNNLKRNGNYFVYIPLKEQLRKLLSSPMYHKLQKNEEEIEQMSDITSGKVYKKLKEDGTISPNDVTIQYNADGVQTFKSSKVSMCPVLVMINEFSYSIRKSNIILVALWASVTRPVLDLLLEPFVNELEDLKVNGFECVPPGFTEPITVKVHAIVAPVDSVERCALKNVHQYNGEFGCGNCYHPGEEIPLGDGFSRIYDSKMYESRTHEDHVKDALKAEKSETVVNGVKGLSMPLLISDFDIIKSFPPEYMHCVLLGVVRLFLLTWFDSKNNKKDFYLGKKKSIFDERMAKICPPTEVTRTPQSISNLCRWKASELKNFLIYYSLIVLKDLIPMKYYKHWWLLVYAITIYDQKKITREDREKAKTALNKFVHDTQKLYGKTLMKYNIHLLIHIPESVENFGALWAWSTFPFEGYNFVLRRMLKNSQGILKQICKSYLRFQVMKNSKTFNHENCNVEGKKFYDKMIGKYGKRTGRLQITLNNNKNFVLYGRSDVLILTVSEKLAIEAAVGENINESALKYHRFLYCNVMYHGIDYERMYKRDNYVIQTNFGTFLAIIGLMSVKTESGRNKYVILGKVFNQLNDVLCKHNDNLNIPSSNCFFTSVQSSNNVAAILPQNITSKCVLLPCDKNYYVTKLVNNFELD